MENQEKKHHSRIEHLFLIPTSNAFIAQRCIKEENDLASKKKRMSGTEAIERGIRKMLNRDENDGIDFLL